MVSGVPVVFGRARDLDRDFHSDVVVGGSLVQLDLFELSATCLQTLKASGDIQRGERQRRRKREREAR